jgi:hypothetical protein
MEFTRDSRNLLGDFDLVSASVDNKTLEVKPLRLLVYRDFILIDNTDLIIPFSKMKEVRGEEDRQSVTLYVDYKDDSDTVRHLQFTGIDDPGPGSIEYCEIMITRGIMSSHLPLKNKDKACYGILGY